MDVEQAERCVFPPDDPQLDAVYQHIECAFQFVSVPNQRPDRVSQLRLRHRGEFLDPDDPTLRLKFDPQHGETD